MARELDIITKAKLTLTKYKSLRDLKSAILVNEYNENSINFTRTLIWKLLVFHHDPQLQDLPITELVQVSKPALAHFAKRDLIGSQRSRVARAFQDLEVPWHQLPRDSQYYAEAAELDIGTRHTVTIDPLSVPSTDEDKFHLELIILDVERLFPQEPSIFVESFDNRRLLIEALFLAYKDLGFYRQGMHELMGLIFKSFFDEQLDPSREQDYTEQLELDLFELYDATNLRLDVYIVFGRLTESVLQSYFSETSLLQESVKFNLKLHELDKLVYHVMLNKLKIQTPIWILRYLRLVLLREIGIAKTQIVWDKMIAFDSSDLTKLLPYLIVLMVLKLRNFVLESENDDVLYALLHYPEEKFANIPTMVQDALLLYNSEANLHSLSKIMVHKYSYDGSSDTTNQLRRALSLKKKKSKHAQPNHDDSIGGNDIKIQKDFERTRLELRLKKRVNDMLNK